MKTTEYSSDKRRPSWSVESSQLPLWALELTTKEFLAWLQERGVDVKEGTLKRWAYKNHLIEKPERFKKGRGSGKGRAVKWPGYTAEKVCAIWAIRNWIAQHKDVARIRPTAKLINRLEQIGNDYYESPSFFVEFPKVPGGGVISQAIAYADIKILVYEYLHLDCKQGGPARAIAGGGNNEKWDRLLDETMSALVRVWVAAREKARKGWCIGLPATVIFKWDSTRALIGNGQFSDTHYFLTDTELRASAGDDIAIFYKGRDVREKLFESWQHTKWEGILAAGPWTLLP